jgi:hypothetical protein
MQIYKFVCIFLMGKGKRKKGNVQKKKGKRQKKKTARVCFGPQAERTN